MEKVENSNESLEVNVLKIGTAPSVKTIISVGELNVNVATQEKMESQALVKKRSHLKHVKVIGNVSSVKIATLHGEQNANVAMRTKMELQEQEDQALDHEVVVVVVVEEAEEVSEIAEVVGAAEVVVGLAIVVGEVEAAEAEVDVNNLTLWMVP